MIADINMMHKTMDVYVPNLPQRTDRRESIEAQYRGKAEFSLHVLSPVPDPTPTHSLWKTFVQAVKEEYEKGSDYFVFGEDDHVFTDAYSADFLSTCIAEADQLQADTLSGGLGWISTPMQVSKRLFWLYRFNGMQFTVVFKRFYDRILQAAEEENGYTLDWKLSEMSERNYGMFPEISRQQEFGYSDLSVTNARKGFLDESFSGVSDHFVSLNKVRDHFLQLQNTCHPDDIDTHDIQVPTYVINLPSRTDRKASIVQEFQGREEFDLHFFPAIQAKRGADGLWESICQIVRIAKERSEEVVLICEDDHKFTVAYDRTSFLRQVIEAGSQGCQILLGGIGNFGDALKVAPYRWWISSLWCTQFMVVYQSAFDRILQADFHWGTDVADEFLSRIFPHKQVIYPFISEQRDFGYSDVTSSNNVKGMILRHFNETKKRFAQLDHALKTLPASASLCGKSRVAFE